MLRIPPWEGVSLLSQRRGSWRVKRDGSPQSVFGLRNVATMSVGLVRVREHRHVAGPAMSLVFKLF